MEKRILIGTRNQAKIDMTRNAFSPFPDIKILSLNDIESIDDSDLKEGDDFRENASKKALYYFKKTGIPTLSTDQILWLEKWPDDNGFIVHIRALANPNSPRATDEEVEMWIKNFVGRVGESEAAFHYAVSLVDEKGVKGFVQILDGLKLQSKQSPKKREGYVLDSFLIDAKTGEFRMEQSDDIAFKKFNDSVKNEIVPLILS